jgi:hypothetical protein
VLVEIELKAADLDILTFALQTDVQVSAEPLQIDLQVVDAVSVKLRTTEAV